MFCARSPRAIQTALLKRILKENQESQFGRSVGFSSIRDVKDYQEKVGLSSYEDVREGMRQQESTGRQVLCMDSFVHRTAGVGTHQGRAFPRTASSVRESRRDIQLIAYGWLTRYGIWKNLVFTILDDQPTSHASTGVTRGTSLSFVFQNLPNFMRRRCFVPSELAHIRDAELRYLAWAIVGMAEPRVSGMVSANPATFMYLLRAINTNKAEIIQALETRTWPDRIQRVLVKPVSLTVSSKRLAQLRELVAESESLSYKDIWPKLCGVICWSAPNCRVTIRQLRSLLPSATPVVEFGYHSSAFIGTLNVNTKSNACLPTLHRHFFEFVERSTWDYGFGTARMLDELEIGKDYYVFVTTSSGLYRLKTEQIVRVTGKIHATPTIEFVQRGHDVVDMTGERLSESDVIEVIETLNEKHGAEISQFVLLNDAERIQYELLFESTAEIDTDKLAAWLDAGLIDQNGHWRESRLAGRLSAPKVKRIQIGTIDSLRARAGRNGFEDPLMVVPKLQSHSDCQIDIAAAAL